MIDFTAGLFQLSAVDAALRLAKEFGIDYVYHGRDSPGAKPVKKAAVKKRIPTVKRGFETDKKYATKVLLSYLSLLREWKETFAPQEPDEAWDERFIEAVRNLDYVEYLADILLFGFTWEQRELLMDKGKEVVKLDERIKSYKE